MSRDVQTTSFGRMFEEDKAWSFRSAELAGRCGQVKREIEEGLAYLVQPLLAAPVLSDKGTARRSRRFTEGYRSALKARHFGKHR